METPPNTTLQILEHRVAYALVDMDCVLEKAASWANTSTADCPYSTPYVEALYGSGTYRTLNEVKKTVAGAAHQAKKALERIRASILTNPELAQTYIDGQIHALSENLKFISARYLGNGQVGPSDPLNPSAHCHGCQRSTHWDKTLMVPIPSHPYSSSVCRKEVVASASQLTIDAKSTTSAIVDLVLDSKSGLPGTAVGAGLGSAWLKSLKHVAPSVACYCRSQTLNEE